LRRRVGNDDNDNEDYDGNGTERHNSQIEATAAAGGNNSHRRSTAYSDDNDDDDNRSCQDCMTGMWALHRGTSTITTTTMRVTMNQQAVLDDDQAVLGLFDKYCEL